MEIQPAHYHYDITRPSLVRAFMAAFVLRLSGLREVAERLGRWLGTRNFSSLSHALSRDVSLRFVRALVGRIESRHRPGRDELVALDSMPLTLPATQRHRCVKFNRRTVGGGVLWSYALQARRGTCPVRVHKVMAGSWNDAAQRADVELIANGPVYLMDRGFVDLGLIARWLSQAVRFILRMRVNSIYEVLATLSPPRPYGSGFIELDARVRLGFEKAQAHPVARLIRARIRTRRGLERLIVISGEMHWTAERILEAYKQRGRIEQFHRFVKDVVGLAHLYNFSQSGIMFLLHTALLVAMLLFLGSAAEPDDTLAALRQALKSIRRSLGLGNPWRRNTNAIKRDKAAKSFKENH
jgi:hypothetical protein